MKGKNLNKFSLTDFMQMDDQNFPKYLRDHKWKFLSGKITNDIMQFYILQVNVFKIL
jgi:hypothetical protein